jgi:phytoene desaturase
MTSTGSKKTVAIIGGGVGGLTSAAVLASAGMQVVLCEKNARVGGKLNWLEIDGYSWDTGPSLLTMPHVFQQLWARLGRRLEDDLTLVPLPVSCRYHWSSGAVIDEDAAFWQRPDIAPFLEYARGLYEISASAFLHSPPNEWHRQLTLANLPKLRHLPKIATFRTLDQVVWRFFGGDPHLVQLFDRFATYNGSSPYRTPAAFNIIAYIEARFGGWYIKGGLYQLARALERICRELGVVIHTGCEVKELQREAGQYRLNGATYDHVVCNQDALSAARRFLPQPAKRREMSISAFVMYLGVAREHPQLAHHNIFFSDDYPLEFRQLFDERRVPDEPTIYVAIHSKADPTRAPAGAENWFVLVNAPALTPEARELWPEWAATQGDRILDRLETRFGLAGLRDAIRVRRHFTPLDFEQTYLAEQGSLYGYASHGVRAAFARPAMQPPGMPGFCFTGGSTHPGGGLPLVCLGGQMAADAILRQNADV